MASNDRSKLSFEQALEKLEQLIAQMEDGEIALADLLEKYESGTALLLSATNVSSMYGLRSEEASAE